MSEAFGIVGNKDPQLLVQTINRQWLQSPDAPESVYKRIAFIPAPGGGKTEHYPMPALGSKEKKLKVGEQRPKSFRNMIDFTCDVDRISSDALTIPLQGYTDPYNLAAGFATDLMTQGKKIWDRELANLIMANGESYVKGISYFSKNHPTNPFEPAYGTFSNDIDANSDKAGFTEAYKVSQKIKGYDNTLMNLNMTRPLVVVPNFQMKLAFLELFNAGLIPQQIGAAAASQTTQLVGAADIIMMPELSSLPNGDNYWYLVNVEHGGRRPFIVRTEKMPQLKLTTENDFPATEYGVLEMYYEAQGGSAYGMPQLCIRCKVK